MMRKAFFLSFCIFLLSRFAFSQENGSVSGTNPSPSAPFPTELTVRATETNILLTWKDTGSLDREIYHIYRHTSPITEKNLLQAELVGTVPEGNQEFKDSPSGGIAYYYLVTAEDNRFHYPIIIPYGNTSARGIMLSPENISKANAVRISALAAQTAKEGVVITFIRDRDGRDVALYRSTSPITTAAQLRQSLLLTILTDNQHSWRDNPIPGISYYYAAVDRELLSYEDESELLYTGNHTIAPAVLPLSGFLDNPSMAYPIRKAPLPTLQLEEYFSDIPRLQFDFPDYRELNPQLKKKLAAFLTQPDNEETASPEPSILDKDKEESGNNFEIKLRKILGEYFLKDRWKQAERALLIMLSEVEDDDRIARIHFYRGQCRYFLGEYEAAYLEFLLSRENYYVESQFWMENCLNQLL